LANKVKKTSPEERYIHLKHAFQYSFILHTSYTQLVLNFAKLRKIKIICIAEPYWIWIIPQNQKQT